jgi:8-oxo-dGTP pyrophosphatase MutT (NUDIX family)
MLLPVTSVAWRSEAHDGACLVPDFHALAAVARRFREADQPAVHILALLHQPSRPLSTLFIEQYRPPVGATCIELPAGLVDEGEDAV